jgi:hypothetical protein
MVVPDIPIVSVEINYHKKPIGALNFIEIQQVKTNPPLEREGGHPIEIVNPPQADYRFCLRW